MQNCSTCFGEAGQPKSGHSRKCKWFTSLSSGPCRKQSRSRYRCALLQVLLVGVQGSSGSPGPRSLLLSNAGTPPQTSTLFLPRRIGWQAPVLRTREGTSLAGWLGACEGGHRPVPQYTGKETVAYLSPQDNRGRIGHHLHTGVLRDGSIAYLTGAT